MPASGQYTYYPGTREVPEASAANTINVSYRILAEVEFTGDSQGYDGGDAVSSEYKPKFEFNGGRVVKVVFDVADDAYVDVERHLAGAMARD
ncbi:MAG: hypothetical protein ACRD07_16475 [Acidimicrobiales bacterium]